MVEPIVRSTFGPRVGHEILSIETTTSRDATTSREVRCPWRDESTPKELLAATIWWSPSGQLPISSSEEWHGVASGVEAIDLDLVAADHEVRVDVGAVDAHVS